MKNKKTVNQNYFKKWYEPYLAEKAPFVNFYLDLISRKKQTGRILDLGCAYGHFLNEAEKRGFQTYGIDKDKEAVSRAKKNCQGKFYQLSLEKDKLPFPDNYFMVVTAFDLVEHLNNMDLLFQEVRRVLRPKGLFFLTTPNYDFLFRQLLTLFFNDDPTHINMQGKNYWVEKLIEVGFSNINVNGIILSGFPPFFKLRQIFRKRRLPVLVKPFLCPVIKLDSNLLITAYK